MKSTIAIFSFLALSAHPVLFGEQGARAPEVAAAKAVEQASVAVPGTKMTPAMLSEVPFLAQNFRPLRSISCVMEEEQRGKDGIWYPSRKERAKVDFVRGRSSSYSIRFDRDEPKSFFHERSVQQDGKELMFYYYSDTKDFMPSPRANLGKIYGRIMHIQNERKDFSLRFASSEFYYLSGFDPLVRMSGKDVWTNVFLGDSTASFEFEVNRNDATGEIYIDYGANRFVIDAKKGAIVKILGYYFDPKTKKMVEEPYLEVTKFYEKGGYLFPIEVVVYYDWKPCARQRIDPETLEINEEYSLSDFILKVPAGTKMDDSIKGSTYIADRPITLQDIKEIESELLALVKKAKNDTQTKSDVK
ncbi:MAG: hypothetical protein LBG65_07885 [Puniceicoccales bacterium]|nr:hypothetical protein [Puniceicoccales bacterium]